MTRDLFIPEFYWHVYHDQIVSLCYNYDERAEYIRECKPENEVKYRLGILHRVTVELPWDLVHAAFKWYSLEIAFAGFRERAALVRQREISPNVDMLFSAGGIAVTEAYGDYMSMLSKFADALEVMHRASGCKCYWNGKTIFGEGWVGYSDETGD